MKITNKMAVLAPPANTCFRQLPVVFYRLGKWPPNWIHIFTFYW